MSSQRDSHEGKAGLRRCRMAVRLMSPHGRRVGGMELEGPRMARRAASARRAS